MSFPARVLLLPLLCWGSILKQKSATVTTRDWTMCRGGLYSCTSSLRPSSEEEALDLPGVVTTDGLKFLSASNEQFLIGNGFQMSVVEVGLHPGQSLVSVYDLVDGSETLFQIFRGTMFHCEEHNNPAGAPKTLGDAQEGSEKSKMDEVIDDDPVDYNCIDKKVLEATDKAWENQGGYVPCPRDFGGKGNAKVTRCKMKTLDMGGVVEAWKKRQDEERGAPKERRLESVEEEYEDWQENDDPSPEQDLSVFFTSGLQPDTCSYFYDPLTEEPVRLECLSSYAPQLGPLEATDFLEHHDSLDEILDGDEEDGGQRTDDEKKRDVLRTVLLDLQEVGEGRKQPKEKEEAGVTRDGVDPWEGFCNRMQLRGTYDPSALGKPPKVQKGRMFEEKVETSLWYVQEGVLKAKAEEEDSEYWKVVEDLYFEIEAEKAQKKKEKEQRAKEWRGFRADPLAIHPLDKGYPISPLGLQLPTGQFEFPPSCATAGFNFTKVSPVCVFLQSGPQNADNKTHEISAFFKLGDFWDPVKFADLTLETLFDRPADPASRVNPRLRSVALDGRGCISVAELGSEFIPLTHLGVSLCVGGSFMYLLNDKWSSAEGEVNFRVRVGATLPGDIFAGVTAPGKIATIPTTDGTFGGFRTEVNIGVKILVMEALVGSRFDLLDTPQNYTDSSSPSSSAERVDQYNNWLMEQDLLTSFGVNLYFWKRKWMLDKPLLKAGPFGV